MTLPAWSRALVEESLHEALSRARSKSEGSAEARLDMARRLLDAGQAALTDVRGTRHEWPPGLEARLARELPRTRSVAAFCGLLGIGFTSPRPRAWPKVLRPRLVDAIARHVTAERVTARAAAVRVLDALDRALAEAALAPMPREVVGELARRILALHGQHGFFRGQDFDRLTVSFDSERAADVLSTLLELVPVRWTDDPRDAGGPARPYAANERFAVGEAVTHPKFGRGVVIESGAAYVVVGFAEGTKKLVHRPS